MQVKRSWNFRKANWTSFIQYLDYFCEKEFFPNSLANLLNTFTHHINTSEGFFIPRGKKKQNWILFWKDHAIDSLIKKKDQLNEQLKLYNTNENRKLLSEAIKKVRTKLL